MARKKMSDYMQTQAYGEWLERYLNPDLTYRELEELIFDAVKLIHLDFGPLTSDKLIVALRNKEPDTPIWPDLKIAIEMKLAGLEVSNYSGYKKLLEEVAGSNDDPVISDTVHAAKMVLFDMVFAKIFSLKILQEILKARVPLVDYLDNDTKEKFKCLSDWHSWIGDVVEIDGNAFRRRKTLVAENPRNWPVKKPDIFPFHLIFARVFVDFLVLGGWNYYGFCKHCGRFFLVQRKGRKQFCSDSCRFQFHHPSKNTQHEKPLISVSQLLKR